MNLRPTHESRGGRWHGRKADFRPRQRLSPIGVGNQLVRCRGGQTVDRFMPLFGWADFENSPVIYDWVHGSAVSQVPAGTKELFCRPWRDLENWMAMFPAMNGWAIIGQSQPGFSRAPIGRAYKTSDYCCG